MTFDEHYFSTHTYKDVSFNRYSQYWWSNRFYAILARRYADRNTRMLEIGTGLGHLAGRLENDFQSYALDVNPWALKSARQNTRQTQFQSASAMELPFLAGVFGVVILKHIVEHLPDPARAIHETSRVIQSRGILILSTPNLDSLLKPLKREKWIGYLDPTHISLKTPTEWLSMVRQAGFIILKIFADGFWDVPYIPLVPRLIQKFLFGSLGGLQAMTGMIFLPPRWGESLILIAQKS
jgi:2-polyprenyl-3-methyl-5-hydroxy-6-metoxy-1,4-benzoquinol methylase